MTPPPDAGHARPLPPEPLATTRQLGELEHDPRFAALQRLFPGQVVEVQPVGTSPGDDDDAQALPDESEAEV